ncbi:CPBP family intramembrane glutamic endopeptidase [Enterococcus rivorum]|uniref:CAAX prenyl protease 2/Lysostaphin resistance protein A-like domain-containing protein n=2 Tax=Enterococcus rivorum TaxID=762845 RepID=A0A1E5KXZ0_9ENTE|nr:type II CAAX endopeptidase family protein [Enterococcus rivorum]MBP2099624.1 membrane protease YdiL (CAAX protease family) [Enterococcus rivorum]OEH82761.1 hypothetical protein BCR26_12020 [Enterococcus rivorum]
MELEHLSNEKKVNRIQKQDNVMKKRSLSENIRFHTKNLFIFVLLVVFTQAPTFISILISLVGKTYQINKLVTIMVSLSAMLIIFGISYWFSKKIGVVSKERFFVKKNIVLIVVGYISMQISSNFFLLLESNQGGNPNLDFYKNIPGILLFFSASIITPILEEVAFRGFLMGYWFKDTPRFGMLINIVLFTALHVPKTIFSLFLFIGTSIIFGTIYQKSKRLEVSGVVHMLNNLPAAIQMLLF